MNIGTEDPVIKLTSAPMEIESLVSGGQNINLMSIGEKKEQIKKIISNFMKETTVYDILPINSLVIVLNSELSLQDSIESMVEQNLFCAIIYDNNSKKYMRIITIRDIIEILTLLAIFVRKEELLNPGISQISANVVPTKIIDNIIKEILSLPNIHILKVEEQKKANKNISVFDLLTDEKFDAKVNKKPDYEYKIISELLKCFTLGRWIKMCEELYGTTCELNSIEESKSLQEASKLISEHRLHRLAVVEKDKRQLYGIISTDLILSYLVANLEGDCTNFEVPICEFNVGSSKIIYADAFESFLETLIKISKNGLSYLPIYNSEVSQCYFSLKLVILLIKANSYFKFDESICKTIEKFIPEYPELPSIPDIPPPSKSPEAKIEPMLDTDQLSEGISRMSLDSSVTDSFLGKMKGKQSFSKIEFDQNESIREIIEKVMSSPEKRIVQRDINKKEVIRIISISDIIQLFASF